MFIQKGSGNTWFSAEGIDLKKQKFVFNLDYVWPDVLFMLVKLTSHRLCYYYILGPQNSSTIIALVI